jgi:hypothetical protein
MPRASPFVADVRFDDDRVKSRRRVVVVRCQRPTHDRDDEHYDRDDDDDDDLDHDHDRPRSGTGS